MARTLGDIVVDYARAFEAAKLPYMVVGSMAVSAHGLPRSSNDVDFVIHLPFSEHARVRAVLERFGHVDIETRKDEFGQRLVVEPTPGIMLELFFTPRNVVYDREYDRRVVIPFRGLDLPFISPEDLALRKLVNTRLRRGLDYDDVVGLLAVQRDAIDLAYLRAHAAFYRVGELLERAIADAAAVDDQRAPPRDAAE